MWGRKLRSEFRHVDTAELVRMYDELIKLWEKAVHDYGSGNYMREAANRIAEELDRRVK